MGPGTLSALHLFGYGGAGSGAISSPSTQTFNLGSASPAATAAIDPGDGRCVDVNVPPQAALDRGSVGVDLNSYTVLGVDSGAVSDSRGRPSTPAGVGVNPLGPPENLPLAGASTGPKLIAVQQFTPSQLLFVFSRPLDPVPLAIPTTHFAYTDKSGNTLWGQGEQISGNVVRVVWPSTVNGVRYEVVGGAVRSQTQEVPNLPGAIALSPVFGGPSNPAQPGLQSGTRVAGTPGVYDLTYDQPMTLSDATKLEAVLADNSTISVSSGEVSQPSPTRLRVSFAGTPVAGYAQKIVELVDVGGTVRSASAGASLIGAAAVATAPIAEGFTDGPDLTAVALNRTADTATYTFDGNQGALSGLIARASFRLISSNGGVSAGASSATLAGPNQVTARFAAGDVANAVGAVITSPALTDNQRKANVAPLAVAVTDATPPPGRPPPGPPPHRVAALRLSLNVQREVAHAKTTFRLKGRLTLPNGLTASLRSKACSGKITVKIDHGSQVVGSATVNLGSSCKYSGRIRLPNSRLQGGHGTTASASFAGNRYLKPKRSPVVTPG